MIFSQEVHKIQDKIDRFCRFPTSNTSRLLHLQGMHKTSAPHLTQHLRVLSFTLCRFMTQFNVFVGLRVLFNLYSLAHPPEAALSIQHSLRQSLSSVSVIHSFIRLFFLVATCGPSNGSEKNKNLFTLQSCQASAHLPHPFIIDLSSSCGNCLQNWPMTHPTTIFNERFNWYSIEDCRFHPVFPVNWLSFTLSWLNFPFKLCKLFQFKHIQLDSLVCQPTTLHILSTGSTGTQYFHLMLQRGHLGW